MLLRSLGVLFCTLIFAAPAAAAKCGGDFNAFLAAIAREAAAAGISQSVVDSAFAGLTPDGAVLAFYRRDPIGKLQIEGDAELIPQLLSWPNLD